MSEFYGEPDLNNQDIKKCIGIFSKIKRNYGI